MNDNLLESPFDHKQIKHALNDAIIITGTDIEGKIIYANECACTISGYSREELIGKDHRIFSSGFHTQEYFSKMWETIISGKIWHDKIRNKKKTGEYYWVDTTIIPIFDENKKVIQYLSLRHDITTQKEDESDSKKSKERLEAALDAGKIGTWETNLTTGKTVWSSVFNEIMGYEINTRPLNDEYFKSIHKDDLVTLNVILQKISNKSLISTDFEFRFTDPKGRKRVYYSTMRVVEENNGKESILIGVTKEITEQKLRAEQLLKSERAAFIGIHTVEIAHDMNNPLAVLQMSLSALEEEYPQNKLLVSAQKSVNKIISIIKLILQTSRPDDDQKVDEFSINDIIESELKLLELDSFFKQNIKVEKSFGLINSMQGQSSHFSRIFGNLIKNSADSLYGRDQKNLKIITEQNDAGIIVRIQDTGCGISVENLCKIFDPFFTTKPINSDKDEPTGTGLGLPSVKRMLESYSGKIEFISKVGVGTSVLIKIPSRAVV